MSIPRRIPVALLLLRLSVFLVMLMWTLDKFVNPDHTAAIYQNFYFISGLSNVLIYIIGVIQLIIILGFVAGFQKRWTYLLVLFFHAVSTFSSFRQYFDPFENLLFFAAWPMLAAIYTLYSLRDLDILWTVDKD
jgi:putative oxidoreductase